MSVEWVTVDEVLAHLDPAGNVLDPTDAALADNVAAANERAYRARAANGYVDDPATVPGADVKLATIKLAMHFHKTDATVDGFAQYDALAAGPVTGGTLADVRRLLGIPKGRVG